MRIEPDKLIFESEKDVVDYITKGIVPCRSNVYDVLSEIRQPGTSLIQLNYDTTEEESSHFAEIMEEVYENVREMQIIAGVGCALSGVLGFVAGRRMRH